MGVRLSECSVRKREIVCVLVCRDMAHCVVLYQGQRVIRPISPLLTNLIITSGPEGSVVHLALTWFSPSLVRRSIGPPAHRCDRCDFAKGLFGCIAAIVAL